MLQLKSRFTGKIIEVNEIDVHWYDNHEEYGALNEEITETIEAKPTEETSKTVLRKRGRPRKEH